MSDDVPERPASEAQPVPVEPPPEAPEQDPWKPEGCLRDSCLIGILFIVGVIVVVGIFWLAIMDSLART